MKEVNNKEVMLIKNICISIGCEVKDLNYVYYSIKAKGFADRSDFFRLILMDVPVYDVLLKLFNLNREDLLRRVIHSGLKFHYIKSCFEYIALVGYRFNRFSIN